MTIDDNLADTIVPRSDQLNSDDLLTGPITVTIEKVSRGDGKDQPVKIGIDGGRMPYLPCKSMRRVLIAAWGAKGSAWVGKRLTLYCDPAVAFGGSKVGGIRISHLSDITEPLNINLTVTRGKRNMFTVQPLQASTHTNTAAAPDKRRSGIVARLWTITKEKHGGDKAMLQQWLMDEGFLSVDPLEELSDITTERLAEVLASVEKKLFK